MPPGALLLDGLMIGTGKDAVFVPAGVKLLRVDGIDCANMPFGDTRLVAITATSGSELLFDDA